ncbi:MAB_1171c family putative transporter [Actinokineospora iranica]|uniref:DUF6545 domain-containing protein n=1 Tax=Actinokineospora iranica TaxID=1271860 RepID=A0A1G6XPH3_9PSEU|nr:MAB_1171c family putative transporter [Actinokineospora iranica]SDD79922.1 hypothetical protein SAMN05216174_11853 [Actinokineospora iranica]
MSPYATTYLCAGVAFATSAVKIRHAFQVPPGPEAAGKRALRLTIAVVAALAGLVMGLSAPPVVVWINRVSGVANLTALIVHMGIIALAASAQVLFLLWSADISDSWPRVRRRLWVLAAIGIALVALFALSDVPVERPVDYESYYARQPVVAVYSGLYLIAYGAAQFGVISLGLNWSRSHHVAGRPWLRRGLRIVAAGSAGGLGFSVARFTAMAGQWFGLDFDAVALPLSLAFGQVGLLAFVVGLLLPPFGPPLATIPGRIRVYFWELRAYRLLRPLWNALRPVNPEAVQPLAHKERFSVRWRVIRQVMEIYDWLATLRPHHDPEVARDAERAGRAAGLTGAALDDLVLACQIKVLVATRPWLTSPAAALADPPAVAAGATEAVYVTEVSQLARLAVAYGSPLVESVAREHLRRAVTSPDPV